MTQPPRGSATGVAPAQHALSAVICTLNEEALIGRVVASVAFADEVLVCDSGSTDATCETASAAGARVITQPWLGYSRQKNHAAAAARHDWVLSLDADEIVTPELAAAIQSTLRNEPDPRTGYAIDRRGRFKGRTLANTERRSTRNAYVRLYHRDHARWDESMPIHEMVRVPGGAQPLDGVLLHDRVLSMDDYFRVYNRNATAEAHVLLRRRMPISSVEVALRPVVRFLWCYLAKGDIRLGRRGLVHACVQASSDFMRFAKAWDLQYDAMTTDVGGPEASFPAPYAAAGK